MIKLSDIQAAITDMLIDAGGTVTASEIDEGFQKPTFFIDVFSAGTVKQNQFYAVETAAIELRYIPKVETREECIRVSEELKNLFLNNGIAVQDRFLTVNEITFDTDKAALLAYFEIEFMQSTGVSEPQFQKTEELMLSERVMNSGTSASLN